jgi:F0F1-type ATP synthase assembly protein I
MITALITGVFSYLVCKKLDEDLQTSAWPWLLLFFVSSNSFLYFLFIRHKSSKLSSFANFFMLATFLKLIVYLAVIVVYLLFNKEEAAPFLITFLLYYIIFTAIEVASVTGLQQKKSEKTN